MLGTFRNKTILKLFFTWFLNLVEDLLKKADTLGEPTFYFIPCKLRGFAPSSWHSPNIELEFLKGIYCLLVVRILFRNLPLRRLRLLFLTFLNVLYRVCSYVVRCRCDRTFIVSGAPSLQRHFGEISFMSCNTWSRALLVSTVIITTPTSTSCPSVN